VEANRQLITELAVEDYRRAWRRIRNQKPLGPSQAQGFRLGRTQKNPKFQHPFELTKD
jgi:hypothetical protein